MYCCNSENEHSTKEELLPSLSSSIFNLALGAVPSPFDCYLCNRGLKTLHLRMKQHFKNGMAAAQFLEADPRVERVIFPGVCVIILITYKCVLGENDTCW